MQKQTRGLSPPYAYERARKAGANLQIPRPPFSARVRALRAPAVPLTRTRQRGHRRGSPSASPRGGTAGRASARAPRRVSGAARTRRASGGRRARRGAGRAGAVRPTAQQAPHGGRQLVDHRHVQRGPSGCPPPRRARSSCKTGQTHGFQCCSWLLSPYRGILVTSFARS